VPETTATAEPAPTALREQDLQRWRLIERFQAVLAEETAKRGGPAGTWSDPRRTLELGHYLSLFLFGLFNPVVKTMRGLCQATQLGRVQREVSGRKVSLGSFSEAQAVVEPALLQAVLQRLVVEGAEPPARPGGFTGRERIIDSTVWQVLPRMTWAFWRRQGGLDNAVRLHVALDARNGKVRAAKLTRAKQCERKQWREFAQPGRCDIADRYYSYDYGQLAELQAAGTDFVVRLRVDTQWVEEHSELLTPADRAAGVAWASVVRLGKAGAGPRVRVVAILGEEETILVATTLLAADFPPEMIAAFYRGRWQVELFFRWLKCILGCRNWLAESEAGVALQVYLALIAAQLLVLYRGARPNRRQMEAIQFYLLGWASEDELQVMLRPTAPARKSAPAKRN
jgi:hypothetical protein